MANVGSIVRKNLRDLSNSMELRELNRQLDWMWKKILGGLNSKDFSDAGLKSVVEIVEQTIANEITADEITANVLKTALAEMMVAQIGVAKIDYAQVVDLFSERIFSDTGIAGKFRINNLEVTQAQIVDLIVNSFRIVDRDGNVYRVYVDNNGDLATELIEDQDGWGSDGSVPEGYSPIASSMTVGDVTAGSLYVSGAADIMKLTAKWLAADSAWINHLTATAAFIDAITTSKIFGGKSLEFLLGQSSHVFRQEEFPNGSDGVKLHDMLVIPSTGQQYQTEKSDTIRFAMDADGNLYYEYDGDGSLIVDGFDLYSDGFVMPVDERGEVTGVTYVWELVQDSQVANTANDALSIANSALSQADFQRVVRIDDEGLHVGDNLADYEVLLDSASVNVVAAGVRVSTFSDKFIRLDNMQIRKVRGGLAISVYNG